MGEEGESEGIKRGSEGKGGGDIVFFNLINRT